MTEKSVQPLRVTLAELDAAVQDQVEQRGFEIKIKKNN